MFTWGHVEAGATVQARRPLTLVYILTSAPHLAQHSPLTTTAGAHTPYLSFTSLQTNLFLKL